MVKVVTHSSLLRNDDVRLKSMPVYTRFCENCDLAAVDDVKHLILQCPKWQSMRSEILEEIANIPDGSGKILINTLCDLVIALLGKIECDFSYDQKVKILSIAARFITKMYNAKVREGIGWLQSLAQSPGLEYTRTTLD